MKIKIVSKEGDGLFSKKAVVSAKGDGALIVMALRRALEIAEHGKWNSQVNEILVRKSNA